jgi:hypothetical protein
MLKVNDFFKLDEQIKTLQKQKDDLEYEILKPYKEAFVKKWGEKKDAYVKNLRIESVYARIINHFDRMLTEPSVVIEFLDYYDDPEGEIFDQNIVPISHLESGQFDEEDLETNIQRKGLLEYQQAEEKEKAEYLKLKEKYGDKE